MLSLCAPRYRSPFLVNNGRILIILALALGAGIVRGADKSENTENPDVAANVIKGSIEGLHISIDRQMQNTIQWFDSIASTEEGSAGEQSSKARVKGYIQLGLAPNTNNWNESYSAFKLEIEAPNWERKLSLIIGNDQNEINRLPYESAISPNPNTDEERNLNIALRRTQNIGKYMISSARLGYSRGQPYIRTRFKWQRDYGRGTVNIGPGLEYFSSDGVGAFLGGSYSFHFDENMSLSLSAKERFIDAEFDTEQKIGLYLSHLLSDNRAWVAGIRRDDSFDDLRTYIFSFRYRQNFHFPWLFWEVEPYTELKSKNLKSEYGAVFSLVSFFGTSTE